LIPVGVDAVVIRTAGRLIRTAIHTLVSWSDTPELVIALAAADERPDVVISLGCAGDPRHSISGQYIVVAVVSTEEVPSPTTDDDIIVLISVDDVLARAAGDGVVPPTA